MSTLVLRPTSDDTIQQDYGAPSAYIHVDEVVLDAGDYCSTNSSSDKLNLYGLTNHTSETGTISSVKVTAYCKRSSTNAYVKLSIKVGGTTYYSPYYLVDTSITAYDYTWNTNPNTGIAWTWSDIDSLIAGCTLSSSLMTRVYNYQLYVTVTYIAPCTVTTQAVTQIGTTTATFNGTITRADSTVTRRGFCYMVGTTGDPTTADSTVYDDGSFGVGVFYKEVTGLLRNTRYRVRAYAVDSIGTYYGTTVDMLTLSSGFILFL